MPGERASVAQRLGVGGRDTEAHVTQARLRVDVHGQHVMGSAQADKAAAGWPLAQTRRASASARCVGAIAPSRVFTFYTHILFNPLLSCQRTLSVMTEPTLSFPSPVTLNPTSTSCPPVSLPSPRLPAGYPACLPPLTPPLIVASSEVVHVC